MKAIFFLFFNFTFIGSYAQNSKQHLEKYKERIEEYAIAARQELIEESVLNEHESTRQVIQMLQHVIIDVKNFNEKM